MRHYFHSCSTRGHGTAGLFFALPVVSLSIYGWTIADHPLALGMIGFIGLGGLMMLAICLRHLYRPEDAYIEISDAEIAWRDWNGLGMRRWSFPLNGINSIREGSGEESGEYLVLRSGLTMRLPSMLIPDQASFTKALQEAAPHIEIWK